jgi:peptide deformylase
VPLRLGVGLAAPQIGVPVRIFVLEDTEEGMSDVSAEDRAAQDRAPFAAKVVVNPVAGTPYKLNTADP